MVFFDTIGQIGTSKVWATLVNYLSIFSNLEKEGGNFQSSYLMLVGFGNLENGVAAMAHPQTTGPFCDFLIRFLYLLEYICNFCFCILYFWQFRKWVVHTVRQVGQPLVTLNRPQGKSTMYIAQGEKCQSNTFSK